jgi:hypothetical protein
VHDLVRGTLDSKRGEFSSFLPRFVILLLYHQLEVSLTLTRFWIAQPSYILLSGSFRPRAEHLIPRERAGIGVILDTEEAHCLFTSFYRESSHFSAGFKLEMCIPATSQRKRSRSVVLPQASTCGHVGQTRIASIGVRMRAIRRSWSAKLEWTGEFYIHTGLHNLGIGRLQASDGVQFTVETSKFMQIEPF